MPDQTIFRSYIGYQSWPQAMSYRIHITSAAERDLNRAADHIEFVLKNPKAADDLLDEAEGKIKLILQ